MTLQGWEFLDAIGAFDFYVFRRLLLFMLCLSRYTYVELASSAERTFCLLIFSFLWYWDSSSISHAGQGVYSRATQPALLLEKWVTELGHRVSWRWRTRKEFCTILKISLYQFAIVIQMKDQFAKPFGTEWNLPPNNEAELITMSLQWF